jgi:metallo-beta-lactamase family protein
MEEIKKVDIKKTETKKARLTFCGGVSTVTGANFLLEIAGKKILIDCGLEQGSELASESNRSAFIYDPASIDILFVTHAHTDHIGRIPKLIRDGFRGAIYSTPATKDISAVMLPDTLALLLADAKSKGILPLYEEQHVHMTMQLWKTLPYYTPHDFGDGLSLFLKDSGHVLGGAIAEFSYNGKKIVFTGDLGNSPALFLRDTDKIEDATYLLMESVYGDRNHESKDDRK